jgi:hypothetical protein
MRRSCFVLAIHGLIVVGGLGYSEDHIPHNSNLAQSVVLVPDEDAYYRGTDVAELESYDVGPSSEPAQRPPQPPTDHQYLSDCDSGSCSSSCECVDDTASCGEPWTLQGWLEPCHCSSIRYGGWIQAGVRTNDQGNMTQVGNVPSCGFTNDADDLHLHQLWGYIARDAERGGCDLDWGFRADFVFGADGPDTQAFGDVGWDNGWLSGGQYGSAIPQLYVEATFDQWRVVAGHFYTIIGYEVVQAPDNFFFTHSYQQYYAEPFTHTGLLVSYDINDQWSITAGYTTGWDSGFNNTSDAHTFLGGISWTSSDEFTSLAYAVNAGRWGNGKVLNDGDIYMHSVVLSQDLGNDWTVVLHHDLGINDGLAALPPGDQAEWYGLGAYVMKQINCCWSAGGRLEWLRDDDGVRVNPLGVAPPLAAGNYFEATAGLNWRPRTNLTVRPELRYDWFDGVGMPFDPVGGVGTANNLFTFAVDLYWTF